MDSLLEMVGETVRSNPERIALVEATQWVSYGDLEKQIVALATCIAGTQSVAPGNPVGLLLPNGSDFVRSYFAIYCLGGVVVPINEYYRRNELSLLLKEWGIRLLLTSRKFAELCDTIPAIRAGECRIHFVDAPVLHSSHPPGSLFEFKHHLNPNSPAMYQFSSGSTGSPKCIARTHGQLLTELDALVQSLGVTSADRFLGVTPFAHVNGLVRSMLLCIRVGAQLYPLANFDRREVARTVEQNRLTIWIGVPFMFGILGTTRFRPEPDFSSLRLCISSSAPLPKKLSESFHQRFGIYVRQLYGSTETGSISVNMSDPEKTPLESVGTPLRHMQVEVLDDSGRTVNPGTVGEVAIKSKSAIRAYERNERANTLSFRDGYFLTGDLGKKDNDGTLYLVGRKGFLINKGGYKVNPREIENLLENHPAVEDVVVFGVPTAFGDEKIHAAVVASKDCKEKDLIEFCKGKVADFKIPSLIEFRDALPRTATGKLRRASLTE